jgi:hypothetical protein
MNAIIKSISIVLLFSGPLRALDMATPLAVFAGKFAIVAEHFERAKIETTWGGFYLRADTQHHFKTSDSLPSSEGFWLGVRALPVEDLKTATAPPEREPSAAYTEKVVGLKFPKVEGADSGLLITLRYGAKCDAKLISELLKGIEVMEKQAEEAQQGGAGQPATKPTEVPAEKGAAVTALNLDSLNFELPSAIRLRVDLAVMQRPEFVERSKESGLNGLDMDDYRANVSSWASVYRARDGVVFLTDDLNMALWVRQNDQWKCLVSGLCVDKTFGGAFPALPARYLGNGFFAITETVPGVVKEKSKDGFPQARAVTFLIDSKDGKMKERSESFVYDQNPPVKVSESWLTSYNIKNEQDADGKTPEAPQSPH